MTMIRKPEELLPEIQEKLPSLKISLKDFKNPTAEFVTNYYTQILEEFYMDVANIRSSNFHQIADLAYAESYQDALALMNLLRTLESLFSQIYGNEFKLTDLTDPVPKRTLRFMVLMNNFHIYADSKERSSRQFFENTVAERNNYKKKLAADLETAKAKINDQASQRAECENLKKSLVIELEQTQNKMQILQQKQKEISGYLHKQRGVVSKLTNEAKTVDQAMEDLSKEVDHLESQMVESPEQLESELSLLNAQLQTKHEELIQVKDNLVKRQQNLTAMAPIEEKLQSLADEVTTLVTQLSHLTAAQKEKKALSEMIRDIQQQCDYVRDHLLKQTAKEVRLQEELDDLQKQQKNQLDGHTDALQQEIREKDEMAARRQQLQDNISVAVEMVSQMESRKGLQVVKMHNKNDAVEARKEKLDARVNSFSENLQGLLMKRIAKAKDMQEKFSDI